MFFFYSKYQMMRRVLNDDLRRSDSSLVSKVLRHFRLIYLVITYFIYEIFKRRIIFTKKIVRSLYTSWFYPNPTFEEQLELAFEEDIKS